jgi:hypothetical protein
MPISEVEITADLPKMVEIQENFITYYINNVRYYW